MARIRSIKPEISEDEVALALTDAAWRLWVTTWPHADDHGNIRGSSRHLALLVWGREAHEVRVPAVLLELVRAGRCDTKPRGMVVVYENNGQRYLHVTGFPKHQRIDNAGKPRVPGPDAPGSRIVSDDELSREDSASRREFSGLAAGSGSGSGPSDQEGTRRGKGPFPAADATGAPDACEVSKPETKQRKPVTEHKGIVGDLARLWSEAYATREDAKPVPSWGGEASQVIALAKAHGEDAIRGAFARYLACGEDYYAGHPLTKFVHRGSFDRFRMEHAGAKPAASPLSLRGQRTADAAKRVLARMEGR